MSFPSLQGAGVAPSRERRLHPLIAGRAAIWAAAAIAAPFALGLLVATAGEGSTGTGAVVVQACYLTLLALSSLACLGRGVLHDGEQGAWLAIGSGLGLWFVGDVAYLFFPRLPSAVADLAFFGFYGAAAVGVGFLIRTARWQRRELFDIAIVLAGLASLWSWLVLDRVAHPEPGAEFTFELAFPLADLALAAVALVLLEAVGWRFSWRWLLLAGGFLAIALADSIYLVQLARDAYSFGTVLDFVWPAGTVAVAGAAWMHEPPTPKRSEARRFSYLFGTVAVVAVFAMLFADHFERISLVSLCLAGVTLLLAVGRTVVTQFYRLTAERSLRAEAMNTVHALAEAVDAKDPYTRYHSQRVSEYARLIAERLPLPLERLDRIEVAGQLHDVGKIAVPDSILLKQGALTDAEYDVIKEHSGKGERIVGSVGLADLAPWIRHHHERWDGRGYPDGLQADESPLEARILAVADSLDAMTSSRSYRAPLSAEAARNEIASNKGRQFDPEVAGIVIELIDEGALPR